MAKADMSPPVTEEDRKTARELSPCTGDEWAYCCAGCVVAQRIEAALARVRAESQLVPSIEDRDWCRQMFSASDHSDGCLICAKLTTVRAEAEAKGQAQRILLARVAEMGEELLHASDCERWCHEGGPPSYDEGLACTCGFAALWHAAGVVDPYATRGPGRG